MTRTYLEVEIKLASPMILGSGKSFGTFSETLPFLPGAALRGAVADILLAQSSHAEHSGRVQPDCAFCQIFDGVSEPVFENFYPSSTAQPTWPLPLTAHTCKAHPGFPNPDKPAIERHGGYDILMRQYWFEQAFENGWQMPFVRQPRCPQCGAEMQPLSGFFGEGALKYYRIQPTIKRMTRTAINRQRMVAQDKLLYTLEVLDAEVKEPIRLNSTVAVEAHQSAQLMQVLGQVRRLGMAKSRGLGAVTVTAKPRTQPLLPPVSDRLTQFNAAMKQETALLEKLNAFSPLKPGDLYFTVDLLADALLADQGIPVPYLPAEQLQISAPVALVRWWARSQIAGGWFAAARLPRRTALATALGSVFLYRVNGMALAELGAQLEHLEARGIGTERARGFGQIAICMPFHTEVV